MSNKKNFIDNKIISLIGMSGVGKSYLTGKFNALEYFSYSCDFIIQQKLHSNILAYLQDYTFSSLAKNFCGTNDIVLSSRPSLNGLRLLYLFLGKLGSEKFGGLNLKTFLERQDMYRQAEIESIINIPAIAKYTLEKYGFKNFINDCTGSVCEVISFDDPNDPVLSIIKDTFVVYIKASEEHIKLLLERHESNPKPLLYNKQFFDDFLRTMLSGNNTEDRINNLDPDLFARQIYRPVFLSRLEKYEKLAQYGCTISIDEAMAIKNADDFFDLVYSKI